MNPVPGRVSSRRRWCSFLLCKKRAHRGDWAKTTHSNLSCGGGASTCRNGQARRRHLTKRSFISKVELMATPRALSRITTTGSALLQLQTDPHRKKGNALSVVSFGYIMYLQGTLSSVKKPAAAGFERKLIF